MANLNSFQKRCVESEGHLLITACPGSGKTTVLSFKAQHLLAKYPTGNILAVTFSKDAADELKERVLKKVPLAKSRIGAGTFHALAKAQIDRAGIKPDLLEPHESKAIINSILDKLADPPELKVVENMFNALLSSLKPLDHPFVVGNPVIKHIWTQYQKIKNASRKMDFTDLLILSIRGMKDGSVKPYGAKWLLADESQDMDELQHAWIKAHAENGAEITLVGDDDQSIFSFRAAMGYEGMEQFKLSLNASSEVLPVNYRCGKNILAAATKLIEFNNPHRIDKPIQSGVDYDGQNHKPVILAPNKEKGRHKSSTEYERIVAEIIVTQFTTHKTKDFYTDWAVLARGNQALNELEKYLIEQNISHSRKSGSFWEQPPIRNYLAVLNYLTENKWFGFAIFINNFLGSDLVFDSRINSLNSLYQHAKDEELKQKVRALIFYERGWQDLLLKGDIESENELLRDVSLFVQNNLSSSVPKTRELQSQKIKDAELILINTKADNLKKRIFFRTSPQLNKGKSADEKREAAKKEGKLFVSLLTMHSSKGLEFDRVWLTGCETSTFLEPKKDGSMVDENEERRVFYVAMTRAKYHLHFSLTAKPERENDALFLQEAGIMEWASGGFGD